MLSTGHSPAHIQQDQCRANALRRRMRQLMTLDTCRGAAVLTLSVDTCRVIQLKRLTSRSKLIKQKQLFWLLSLFHSNRLVGLVGLECSKT